jgi:hypothetical protein
VLISTPGLGEAVWELPALILHPFSERASPEPLLENSKAALMLSGLLPSDGYDRHVLTRKLLAARYSEIRCRTNFEGMRTRPMPVRSSGFEMYLNPSPPRELLASATAIAKRGPPR